MSARRRGDRRPGHRIDEALLAGLGWLREHGHISPVIEGDACWRPGACARRAACCACSASTSCATSRSRLRLLTCRRRARADRTGVPRAADRSRSVIVTRTGAAPRAAGRDPWRSRSAMRPSLHDSRAAARRGPARARRQPRADGHRRAQWRSAGSDGLTGSTCAERPGASRRPSGDRRQAAGGLTARRRRDGRAGREDAAAFHLNLTALSYVALLVASFSSTTRSRCRSSRGGPRSARCGARLTRARAGALPGRGGGAAMVGTAIGWRSGACWPGAVSLPPPRSTPST